MELITELWVAREMLRHQGQRTDLTSGLKSRSWTQYCEQIGSSKDVVNRWLRQWFEPSKEPGEDKMSKNKKQNNEPGKRGMFYAQRLCPVCKKLIVISNSRSYEAASCDLGRKMKAHQEEHEKDIEVFKEGRGKRYSRID